jgi:hypothetical protein
MVIITKTEYGYDEWTLDKRGERIAKRLNMSVAELLTRLSCRQLGSQLPRGENDIENHSEPPKGLQGRAARRSHGLEPRRTRCQGRQRFGRDVRVVGDCLDGGLRRRGYDYSIEHW